MDTVVKLRIRGLVQGVGYRWAMAQAAQRLGVTGWVRNRHDGTVEAMVAGPAESVDRLVAWAQHGPPSAVVEGIDTQPGEGVFESFDQRPSA